jgi:KaiC/GvpD/RAD55 family RecA-like ATPase
LREGPEVGRTIFCLDLAKNMCMKGKKVLYMSFEEPELRLKSHMKAFGADVEGFEKNRALVC